MIHTVGDWYEMRGRGARGSGAACYGWIDKDVFRRASPRSSAHRTPRGRKCYTPEAP